MLPPVRLAVLLPVVLAIVVVVAPVIVVLPVRAMAPVPVVVPVADVAPDLIHPESGVSTKSLASTLVSNESEVRPTMGVQLSPPHTHPSYDAFDDGSDIYSPRMEELVRAQLEGLKGRTRTLH